MLYKAHPRDRQAWISLVFAGHPKAEVGSAGPPYNSSSRLQATRDARDLGVVAALSDWVVDETQPFPSNSSDDLALQLRHDKYTSTMATKAGLLEAGLLEAGQLASSAALASAGAAASLVVASAASLVVADAPSAAASAASLLVPPPSWGLLAISRSHQAFSLEGISLEPNLGGLAPPGAQLPSPPPSPPSETPREVIPYHASSLLYPSGGGVNASRAHAVCVVAGGGVGDR